LLSLTIHKKIKMIPIITLSIIGLVLIIVGWTIYNRLIAAKNIVNEAFSGIDIQLKKRFELIPNLVEAVKGYNAHEAAVLEEIVKNRSGVGNSIDEMSQQDKSITKALKQFRIQVEAYPELKANTQFLKLMDNLSVVENELSMARRYFNGATRDYNTQAQVFPAVLVAKIAGFKTLKFYELDNEAEREAPQINLNENE